VRAFRRAASSLKELGPEKVAALAATGSLQTLPGIGEKTEKVIVEALAGGTPSYLLKLEEETGETGEPDPAVVELRAALRGDCHSHSDWSDGGSPIDEMAVAARALGHDWWALTDHSPRLTIAQGLSRERLLKQLAVVEELNERLAPFRILTGIEVDINEDGTLDQDDDILERLDVVVASVHSKLRMEPEGMTRRMLLAVSNPNVDILGHCTGRIVVGRGRPESTFDADLVFAACAEYDTAVEINSRPERLDPPRRLLHRAIELGCRFAIDTDAHAPGQLEWQTYGCTRAIECKVPRERIVNTMACDAFLAWTASHAA
jgi:putative hydrolase